MGEPDGQERESGDNTPFVRSHCPLIVPREGFTASPSYVQLADVWDNAKGGAKATLVVAYFTHVLVILRGRMLGRHADGLRQRKAWVIEERDEALLGPPAEGETAVTSIEFVYENIPRVLADLRGLMRRPEKHPPGNPPARLKNAIRRPYRRSDPTAGEGRLP